jgi:hypothetical protein
MARTRRARGWTRAGAAVLGAGAALVVSAGPAAAAGEALRPFVDCVVKNADGSWRAVLGYENPTRAAVSVPHGSDNQVTPRRAQASVPTRFEPGVQRGVFSVVVDRGAGLVWHLGDDNLKVRRNSVAACPPPTEMPAEGNGTGVVVALGAAGMVGALYVSRARRRAGTPGPQEVGSDA